MATLYSFKIRGLTSGSATIATVDVTYDSDGYIRFIDLNGDKRWVMIANHDMGDVAALLRAIFTGAGGVDAGSAGVQGHRVFGEPALIQ